MICLREVRKSLSRREDTASHPLTDSCHDLTLTASLISLIDTMQVGIATRQTDVRPAPPIATAGLSSSMSVTLAYKIRINVHVTGQMSKCI